MAEDRGGVLCTYKYKFPVDRYDRPGGFYSMADLPIARHKVLVREGYATARDRDQEVYEIYDAEKNWRMVVPFADVEFPEES